MTNVFEDTFFLVGGDRCRSYHISTDVAAGLYGALFGDGTGSTDDTGVAIPALCGKEVTNTLLTSYFVAEDRWSSYVTHTCQKCYSRWQREVERRRSEGCSMWGTKYCSANHRKTDRCLLPW